MKNIYNIFSSKTISGSVTIFLSLSISLIVSLVFYTIESCHLDALVARSEGITYLSLDSLFGQYCLPLFEEFGIFCLNEQGMDIENEIKKYADQNSRTPASIVNDNGSFLNLSVKNVDITSKKYLTDDDAAPFVEQICDHCKYMELASFAEEICDYSNTSRPEVFSTNEDGNLEFDFSTIDNSTADVIKNFDNNIDTESGTSSNESSNNNSTSDLNSDFEFDEDFIDNVSSYIGHIIKNGLLSFLVGDPNVVSTDSVDKATLPSVTCQLSVEGIENSYGYYKDITETTLNKAIFCEYIYHTFGCYTEPNTDSYLKYPMEYIINGGDSDDVNFINSCGHILNLRLCCNLLYLLSDPDKYADAQKVAEQASSIPIPGAKYIALVTILTIWATAEGLLDVRDMVNNKNVPLVKSKETWTLELYDLLLFSSFTQSKNDGDSGLTYKRYLELVLATENNISLYYRTMDAIQMNICHNYNEDFRISKCVYAIDVHIEYSLPYLFLSKKVSYNSKGHQSYK